MWTVNACWILNQQHLTREYARKLSPITRDGLKLFLWQGSQIHLGMRNLFGKFVLLETENTFNQFG